ncbi:MAG: NAD(P) transhydrogenase subunit alpha [Proteobacteria bacterium]|nr:NAD(P) transhydrogenase subunit alpha [Pseudomonadota bacterium]
MTELLNFIGENITFIYLMVLMIFVGIELISHVPSVLHTPLMSGANAIHGVVLIGAIIVLGKSADDDYLSLGLGFAGVIVGTLNVMGGFVVTDRMLEMFKKKPGKGGAK